MGVNINFRKDYGMEMQDLLAQIRAWRKVGYTDEEIQAELDNLERDPKETKGADQDGDL